MLTSIGSRTIATIPTLSVVIGISASAQWAEEKLNQTMQNAGESANKTGEDEG
ncbi:MAG: hypothetical protein ACRD6U_10385 [Nitrososphaeraceae archaeon]